METTRIATTGMSIAHTLFLILSALGVVTFVAGFLLTKKLSDYGKVLLTLLLVVFFITAPAAWLYWNQGRELVRKGTRLPTMLAQLDELQEYFDSEVHLQAKDKFSLCVLGDSTHFAGLEPPYWMLRQMHRSFPEEYKASVEWYGFHFPGLDAYDYFFLLNWLVSEKPDLVVIPLNLRAFGDIWANSEAFQLPEIERYIQLAEIPAAMRLSNQTHDLRWERILLRKLDYALFDSDMAHFFRGTKRAYDKAEQNINTSIGERFANRAEPLPYDTVRPKLTRRQVWFRRYRIDLSNGHPLLDVLEQLNRLAHENGVEVMYYTVQCEVKRVPQEELFQIIRDRIANDPGVHFVDLLGLVKPDQFAEGEHLTQEGIQVVATHLSSAIADIVRQRTGQP